MQITKIRAMHSEDAMAEMLPNSVGRSLLGGLLRICELALSKAKRLASEDPRHQRSLSLTVTSNLPAHAAAGHRSALHSGETRLLRFAEKLPFVFM